MGVISPVLSPTAPYVLLTRLKIPRRAAVVIAVLRPLRTSSNLDTDENVRAYLGRDEVGARRKSTKVNVAIRETPQKIERIFRF